MKKAIIAAIFCLAWLAGSAFTTDTLTLATRHVPGLPMTVQVIIPDNPEGKQLPTVYLLNGYDGDHTQWTRVQPRLGELADELGMVMVMPQGRDSWYWDSPKRPEMRMETFITTELVPAIDARYPTIPEAGKRAVTGLSMGGQGAFWLAMRHPDIFGNVGSTSGGLDIRPFPKNWKMSNWLGAEDENKEIWDEHAAVNLVPSLQPGQLNIIFDCGVDDFFAGVNEDMHQALLAAGIPHDYISRPGAHTNEYWRNSILYHLLYFSEAFQK